MMQEVEVLKTIQELICSFFSEEQFTLSSGIFGLTKKTRINRIDGIGMLFPIPFFVIRE